MNNKKILLWNPISNHGHLNMYLEVYAEVLTGLGHTVYYCADLDEDFELDLISKFPTLISIENLIGKNLLQRWKFKWAMFVARNLIKKLYIEVKYRLLSFLKIDLKQTYKVEFDTLTGKLEYLSKNNYSFDLIICMYLDMTHLGRYSRKVLRKNKAAWTGLLFHPIPLRNSLNFSRKSWFSHETNVGGIFFTDREIQNYRSIASAKQSFSVFPDVTRRSQNPRSDLNLNIAKLAKGRKIIGLIGALDGNKKLIGEFLAMSKDNRLEGFYFLLAGEVYESSLDLQILEEIRKLSGNIQENLYVYDYYIKWESDFDYLIEQTDYLFACYKNFDSSANILAKSALFQKPVIVTGDTWIGKLVEEFQLGLTVNNLNIDEFVAATLKLGDIPRNEFRFDSYAERVSIDNLATHMREYLGNIWESSDR